MLRERWIYRGGTALLLATALTGFGSVAHGHASAAHASLATPTKKVVIKESNERYRYMPRKITVTRGTTVTWANMTDVEHNVTAQGAVKVDKDIEKGKSASFTFTKPGTYAYHCEYHPYMKGTVVVR